MIKPNVYQIYTIVIGIELDARAIDLSQKWRGTLRFLPDLEIRPSSIAANPVESQEASPSSIVSLTSQRHPEKLPEVTGISRGNPGFPAVT